MRKTVIVLFFIFVVFSFSSYSQINCGPTSFGCISTGSCANAECVISYNACDGTASATCKGSEATCNSEYSSCVAGCTPAFGSCVPACESTKQSCLSAAQSTYTGAVSTCQTEAKTLQETITKSGIYNAKVGCGEMTSCVSQVNIAEFSSFNRLQDCNGQITDEMKKKIIEKHPAEKWQSFLQNTPENNALIKPGSQLSPDNLAARIDTGGLSDEVLAQTDVSTLSNEGVRTAMDKAGRTLPWWKQTLVTANVLKSNPYIQAGGIALGIASFGKEIYDLFIAEDEEEQVTYNQNNYYGAQSDINNAQNSQAQGTSKWTNCPGHRDGRCNGQSVCVADSNSGASQCIAALPGGNRMDVKFGSIYVIDTQKNNMFTLTGSENEGVVYQQDGFVNIDKGGITKISVAGQGALITDFNNNHLYMGGGTTTYLGIGNENVDTYLTNTLILDTNSKVAVNAVNDIEQNKLKEAPKGNLKQNKELALTFNKRNLISDKNAADISKFQENYYILTRGFSNIILVEKDKIFPLMSRIFAKGSSLIVNNQNIKISNVYVVKDDNYEYTIKTIGDSTKVLANNGKIIQDSGPLTSKLTKRQTLLLHI